MLLKQISKIFTLPSTIATMIDATAVIAAPTTSPVLTSREQGMLNRLHNEEQLRRDSVVLKLEIKVLKRESAVEVLQREIAAEKKMIEVLKREMKPLLNEW